MVFQDPYTSLNPRMTVGEIIAEPLLVHGVDRRPSSARASTNCSNRCSSVPTPPTAIRTSSPVVSGNASASPGRSRCQPDLVVLDEPVSALDVSIQAEIIRLLQRLRDELGLAYLFIAHDLSVVRHLSHRVAVMYLGKIVEVAPAAELYSRPAHPYTQSAALGGADSRSADRAGSSAHRARR